MLHKKYFFGGNMKKITTVFRIGIAMILFVSMIFVACEGPAGKDGAAGAAGATGPAGPAGPAGPSGAEQCGVCHNNSADLFAKQVQWSLSKHGTGEAFDEGYRTACAGCHASQGFLEVTKTGLDTTKAGFYDAATINCRTCHKIHSKYDKTDWDLTYTAPYNFRWTTADDANKTADMKMGNLCGKCHQARTTTPVLTLADPTKEVSITSLRYGPHYGPQSNMVAGVGGYKIPGSVPYPSSNVHGNIQKGCVSCHMADGGLPIISGHTMVMKGETGTPQKAAACTPCHSEVTSTFNQKDGVYDANKKEFEELEQLMITKGWINADDHYVKATSAAPLKISTLQAAALYNYKFLSYDKSYGMHNPKYYRALLKNTLEFLKK